MIKNYLQVAIRSLKRNYLYTSINILGMAVGLSCIIVTLLLFEYEFGFDAQHKGNENTFRVNSRRLVETDLQKWGVVPDALGPNIVNDIPEVKQFCRYSFTSAFLVQYEDIVHRERIALADQNFFDWFSFNSQSGSTKSFQDKQTIIISHEASRKYFGEENALGKTLTLRKDNKIFGQFTIGAVLDKIPMNSSFRFEFILPHDNIYQAYVYPGIRLAIRFKVSSLYKSG